MSHPVHKNPFAVIQDEQEFFKKILSKDLSASRKQRDFNALRNFLVEDIGNQESSQQHFKLLHNLLMTDQKKKLTHTEKKLKARYNNFLTGKAFDPHMAMIHAFLSLGSMSATRAQKAAYLTDYATLVEALNQGHTQYNDAYTDPNNKLVAQAFKQGSTSPLYTLLGSVNQHLPKTHKREIIFAQKTDPYDPYFSKQLSKEKDREGKAFSTLSTQVLTDFKRGQYDTASGERSFSYENLNRMLQIHIDRQLGINTYFTEKAADPERGLHTNRWCIRTVDSDKTFQDCVAPDHPVLESDNLLLRALNTTRGIDHALAERSKLGGLSEHYTNQQKLLKQSYSNLLSAIVGLQADYALSNQSPAEKEKFLKRIKKLEIDYNTHLTSVLCENQLARNLHKATDFSKLLDLYRNLASSLDPACVVRTITKAENATFTETAYPVTEKTKAQKDTIEKMRTVEQPTGDQAADAYKYHKAPLQEAISFFVEKLGADDTALADQARKMLPTAKNAWVVHSEVKNNMDETAKEMWSVRSGTVVYMGPKAKDVGTGVEDAKENLNQIYTTTKKISDIKNITFHDTVLNTYSPDEDQIYLIDTTHAAIAELNLEHNKKSGNVEKDKNKYQFSVVPINPLGRQLFKPFLAAIFHKPEYKNEKAIVSRPTLGNERGTLAADVTYLLNTGWLTDKKPDAAVITRKSCASGRDRTGIVEEKEKMAFYDDAYNEVMGKKLFATETNESVRKDKVAVLRARGLHSAFLATARAPGSFGIKKKSKINIFPKEVLHYFHDYPCASTNKEPILNKEIVEAHAFKRPSISNPAVNPVLTLLDAYLEKAGNRFVDRFFTSFSTKRAILNDLRQLLTDVQLGKPTQYEAEIKALLEKKGRLTAQDIVEIWATHHGDTLSQQRGFSTTQTRTEKLVEQLKAAGAKTEIFVKPVEQKGKSVMPQEKPSGTEDGVEKTTRQYQLLKRQSEKDEHHNGKRHKHKEKPAEDYGITLERDKSPKLR